MFKNRIFFLLLLYICSLCACIPNKRLYYFHDQSVGSQKIDSLSAIYNIHRIQPNDRIFVIISSPDPSLTGYLNVGNSSQAGASPNEEGYLVNKDGIINFPVIGNVHIQGLTTDETATLIKEKLSYLFKDIYVNVKLKGRIYYLTAKNGGEIPIFNERLTIIEALTHIPSIDPYDNRNEVMLIREENGIRTFDTINLTSKRLFESDKFYLKNNDFVYVKPGKFNQSLFNTRGPLATLIGVIGGLTAIFFTVRSFVK